MMAAGTPSFDLADSTWLAHRYDRSSDRFLFRHVPQQLHSQGPFLTDELVGDRPGEWIERSALAEPARHLSGPVHFIFHSAFCGSTLLARGLDRPGLAMSLSEPVLLNDIVGIRRRAEMRGADIARLADDALHLLGRRWPDTHAVAIKPSNIVNGLIPAIMALRPESRAVLLHAPLRQFLSSVARKGLWCRLWVRELLEGLLREGAVQLGFEDRDYFRLTDLQVAAVGWLAQHAMFHRFAGQFGPAQMATLNSDLLTGRTAEVVEATGRLFALPMGAQVAAEVADGPAFTRHSKSGQRFSAADRAAERQAAEAAHGDEIDKVEHWAHAVADRAGIAMTLPHALVS
ncbi:hypothetical protein GV829_06560 [Sphingomonas lacunae]|uniref:Sulfotransferase family protein n=2 Tax=Sphingomonas lacunae TaxID=2698828 RepID=A0A6M4AX06_9SPHN|nr:hypothetical protein GV829_06560 [Sphingomonas lacunae]